MTSIFIAKLDFGVTQEELKEAFEKYGVVKKVTIATDRETQKPKGFAFVEMNSPEEAQQAVDGMEEIYFNGRRAVVKIAEDRGGDKSKSFSPRSPQQGRPGGYDRSSGGAPRSNDYNKSSNSDYKGLDNKKPEGRVLSPEELAQEIQKKAQAKKKEAESNSKPKVKKMEAYKKTNKRNKFFDYDDEDDFAY